MADTTSRGAPYPEGSDPNDVPGYIQDLAEWVNDRPGLATLTTAQRNALTGAELWAGRHIWNTTTSRLEVYTGSVWLPTPAPGRLLGRAVYKPAGAADLTNAAGTGADVDAVNLAVTFTAPLSGAVLVELDGVLEVTATGDNQTPGGGPVVYGAYWQVREGASSLGEAFLAPGLVTPRRHAAVLEVTGLTAGQSYTYKWGHFRQATVGGTASATIHLRAGGSGTPFYGPATMRVIEA